MKKYTLVVVDMQPDFVASNDPRTQSAVSLEIERARRNGMAVVFMEIPYLSPLDETGYEPTHKFLKDLVRGYDKTTVLEKADNGAVRLLDGCKHFDFCTKRFRICGVNTELCVRDLVLGLLRASPKSRIKVICRACNTIYKKKDTWSDFPKSDQLVLEHGLTY